MSTGTKATEAKKQLLEESVRLIEEQGLAGLSFREMARRAGVSHQAPYYHFKNREGILAAIALEGKGRKDPQEVLRKVLRAYVSFATENPVHFRIMFRPELVPVRRYPEVREQASLTFQRLTESLADCHQGAPKTGRRLVEVANALWAAAHGLATLWLDGPMKVCLSCRCGNGYFQRSGRQDQADRSEEK
jgi:AcrR family transcriptional regulator